MKTFSIYTLGCKVNQYETQQVRQFLEQKGLIRVPENFAADLFVINTCSVTSIASAKSRQFIRKAHKLNPDAHIVVFGCLTALDTDESNNLPKNITLINDRKAIADTLDKFSCDDLQLLTANKFLPYIKPKVEYKIKSKNLTNLPALSELTTFQDHTRAFLKIQDGCDARCTYCIIPKTRPIIESKQVKTILNEAQNLVKSGHKEIVLTGIFLGAFGQKTAKRKFWDLNIKDELPNLLDRLSQIPGLQRIRLSSLEPGDVSEKLLDKFVEYKNIMPHLHLSLQSGSDNILKKMARQYRTAEFIEKIEMIKSKLNRPAITCDIIVGFPGESEKDFDETVELAKKVCFSKMHIFPFSVRAGTAAAKMPNHLSPKIIKQRTQILGSLDIELGKKFREQFLGEKSTILLENENGQIAGRSECYFLVNIEPNAKKLKPNELVSVMLINNKEKYMIGRICD